METLEDLMYRTMEEFEGSGTLEMYTGPIEMKNSIAKTTSSGKFVLEDVFRLNEQQATVKVYNVVDNQGQFESYEMAGQGDGVKHKDQLKM